MIEDTGQVRIEPFYLAVSAQANARGEVNYRLTKIDRQGGRLVAHQIGFASPGCAHYWCRVANLGAAAVDWAYLLQADAGVDTQFHPEQIGLEVGPE